MIMAALGSGAAVLRVCGAAGHLTRGENAGYSFALGLGVIGWAMFFLGIAGYATFWPVLAMFVLFAAGSVCLFGPAAPPAGDPVVRATPIWFRLCLIAVALLLAAAFLFQALAPPADADTLAYHFDIPRRFAETGQVVFIPRAIDGAAPLLVHMTYLAGFALDGEATVKLWTLVTAGAAAVLVYLIARRHVSTTWAGVAALLFVSAPAAIYGSVSGQVEMRSAVFVLAAAAFLMRCRPSAPVGFVLVAGLAVGFFAGTKYFGLLFAAAAGAVLLLRMPRPIPLVAFGIAALLAGGQWYGWNWFHTGDPLFPALFAVLDLPDSFVWTTKLNLAFSERLSAVEVPLGVSVVGFFGYPFIASLAPPVSIEAGRVGLGPWFLVALPFALGGLWQARRRLLASPLFVLLLLAVGFYVIWFVTGSSQRVRHLLPLYPLLVIGMVAACARLSAAPNGRQGVRRAIAVGVTLTLGFHLGVAGLYTLPYARHVLGDVTREAFFQANITKYAPVPWINTNLPPDARVMTIERQLLYPMRTRTFNAAPYLQAEVDMLGEPHVSETLHQIRRLGITHLLYQADPPGRLAGLAGRLRAIGCETELKRLDVRPIASRTLGGTAPVAEMVVSEVAGPGCPPP